MPRLCRPMPVVGSKTRAPNPLAFDWMSDTRHTGGVAGAEVHRAARPRWPRAGRRCAARDRRARRRRPTSSGASSPDDVGALVEDRGAVVAGRPGRLHQQVGPRRRRRVVGQREALGDRPHEQEREVALDCGRHRPDVVVPRPGDRGARPSRRGARRGRRGAYSPPPMRHAARARTRRRRSPSRPCSTTAARGRAATPGRTISSPGRRRPAERGPRRRRRRRAGSTAARSGEAREALVGVARSRARARRRAGGGRARSCSASQPSTQPGTGALRTSPVNGMTSLRPRRGAARGRRPSRPARWRRGRAARRRRGRGRGRTGHRPCRTGAGW